MTSREIKLIRETIGHLDNIVKGLNINSKAIEQHSSTGNLIRTKLEGYIKKKQDPEYIKTLSPPEQTAFMQNANALYETYEKLRKELEYLDMTKHPVNVTHASQALDKAYLLIDYLYKNIFGECGDIIVPHFACIRIKDIAKATYTQCILSLSVELEAFVHDIYVDHIKGISNTNLPDAEVTELLMFIPAYACMTEAYMWLSIENTRLKTEALPEIAKINIPDEILPEIPAGPVSDKKFN